MRAYCRRAKPKYSHAAWPGETALDTCTANPSLTSSSRSVACAHFTARRGRGVAHDVRDLVRQPERNEFWIEAETLRVRIGHTGEVLEAHERDAASVDHQLAGIGGANANHNDDIEGDVGLEQLLDAPLGLLCERDDIGAREQCVQVIARRLHGRAHDFFKVWARRLQHIVVPIRRENLAMPIEIRVIRRFWIGGVQHGEKIRKEVDQHQQPGAREVGAL